MPTETITFRVRRVDLGLPKHARAAWGTQLAGLPRRRAVLFTYVEPPDAHRMVLFDLDAARSEVVKLRGELRAACFDLRRGRAHALCSDGLHELSLRPLSITRTLRAGLPKNSTRIALQGSEIVVGSPKAKRWAVVDVASYEVTGRTKPLALERPELLDDASYVGDDRRGRHVAILGEEVRLVDAKGRALARAATGRTLHPEYCALTGASTFVALTSARFSRDVLVVEWGEDAGRRVRPTTPIPEPRPVKETRSPTGRAVRENETFEGVRIDGAPTKELVFTGPDFRRCKFLVGTLGGRLSTDRKGRARVVVRGLTAERCEFAKIHGYRVAFEDCTLDTPKVAHYANLTGCVFAHVVVRGDPGFVRIEDWSDQDFDEKERARLRAEDARYYDAVDWALDVREVEGRNLRIASVPPHLVRRDPTRLLLVWAKDATHPVWSSEVVARELGFMRYDQTLARRPFVFFWSDPSSAAAERALRAAGIVDDATGAGPAL